MKNKDLHIQLNSELENLYADHEKNEKVENEKIRRKYMESIDFNLLRKLSAAHRDSITTTSSSNSSQVRRGSSVGTEKNSDFEPYTVTHKITMGDSYRRLALRYHSKPRLIKTCNKISKPLKYMIGRELVIPVGSDYIPKIPKKTDFQDQFLPGLMKTFMNEVTNNENRKPESWSADNNQYFMETFQKFSRAKGWQKPGTNLSSRNRLIQFKVASSKSKRQAKCIYSRLPCDSQNVIELCPINHATRPRIL